MSALNSVLSCLAGVFEAHGAAPTAAGVLALPKLSLHIHARILDQQTHPGGVVLVVLYDTREVPGKRGMEVTCVGIGGDPDHAARDSVANFSSSVLPVLDLWRSGHSCLAEASAVTLSGHAFELLAGPLTCRGVQELETGEGIPVQGYGDMMIAALSGTNVANRLHWLECFAGVVGGNINATCRLDNRDWTPGQRCLEANARGWPVVEAVMQSRRQFLLLVPKTPDAPKASLWGGCSAVRKTSWSTRNDAERGSPARARLVDAC